MINFNRRGLLKKIGALLGYVSIPGCLSVFNKGKTMEKNEKSNLSPINRPIEQHWVGDGFYVQQ